MKQDVAHTQAYWKKNLTAEGGGATSLMKF